MMIDQVALLPPVRSTAPGPLPAGVPAALARGLLEQRRLAADSRQTYWLYRPPGGGAGAPVLVSVHGISRNAAVHAQSLRALAAAYDMVVVAPLFARDRFPDYQRLGRVRRGERADLMLLAILGEVRRLTSARTGRIFLTGFSGGAQFAHRFAFAHPARVAALAVCAAGWYSFPDTEARFPRGLRLADGLPGVTFEPARFLRIPAIALVGARDIRQDGSLNMALGIVSQQGSNRVERAARWIAALQEAARAHGLATRYELALLPRVRHSYAQAVAANRGDLPARLFGYFFGPQPADGATAAVGRTVPALGVAA